MGQATDTDVQNGKHTAVPGFSGRSEVTEPVLPVPSVYLLGSRHYSWTQLHPLSHYFSPSLRLSSFSRQLLHFLEVYGHLSYFGLPFCEWRLLSVAVHRLLIAGASLAAERSAPESGPRSCEYRLSCLVACRILPRPGIQPCNPCLGRQIFYQDYQGSLFLRDCFLPLRIRRPECLFWPKLIIYIYFKYRLTSINL